MQRETKIYNLANYIKISYIVGYLKSVCKIPASTSYRWIVRIRMSAEQLCESQLSWWRSLIPSAAASGFYTVLLGFRRQAQGALTATGHLNTRGQLILHSVCYCLNCIDFFYIYIYNYVLAVATLLHCYLTNKTNKYINRR